VGGRSVVDKQRPGRFAAFVSDDINFNYLRRVVNVFQPCFRHSLLSMLYIVFRYEKVTSDGKVETNTIFNFTNENFYTSLSNTHNNNVVFVVSWLAVWLSGNALALINVVALHHTRLVPGWVTVCERINHLGMPKSFGLV